MEKEPQTDNDWTMHSLNIHGTFFQYKIAEILNNYKKRFFVSAFEQPAEIIHNGKSAETKIDILGFLQSKKVDLSYIYFIIECKKCNPEFIDWIFYPRILDKLNNQTTPIISLLNNKLKKMTHYKYRMDFNSSLIPVNDLKISGDCREARGNYFDKKITGKTKTKTSNETIEKAAYQVTLGTHFLANNEKMLELKDFGEFPYQCNYYVPIIVTNANLFVIDFDIDDIDLITGEIPLDKPNLIKSDFLVYEYPIPPHLKIKNSKGFVKPGLLKSDFNQTRHIIVVNSSKFLNLLDYFLINEDLMFTP